ncbi:hypothetical protein ACO34A_03215 [Rhizobium sp. ACO-34A]|nr:tannase/feruloyl esterase family alpha/beta hydrolase [Rhizobium sp. ACO-34A]ATN32812.1 hypothetical protein ACO34A_03215 [Rhizobium sp. ACO-34A]
MIYCLDFPKIRTIVLGALMMFGMVHSGHAASVVSDPSVVTPVMECGKLLFADFSDVPEAPTRITSAETVPASGSTRSYCKITGYVAPQVGFELRLPVETWTQRLVFTGCGGLCGIIDMNVQQAIGCTPIENQTVALAASNLGHTGWNPGDGIWANGDPAARVDFGYRGVHAVTLATKAIIAAYYGQAPKYSFFVGCSDGGREALMEAQRFPDDFDGIVAGAPAYNVSLLNVFHHVWNVRANTDPDGKAVLISSRIPILHEAVLKACDAIDGLKDGVIDDPAQCEFDVGTITCKDGTDTSKCLTSAEADAVRKIYAGPTDDRGRRLTVSGPAPGSEIGWPGVITADDPDMPPFNRLIATGFAKNIAWWDAPPTSFELADITFNESTLKGLEPVMSVLEAVNPDLHPFADSNGKLILWHGAADPHFPAANTLAYRDAVLETVGEKRADDFLRTFIIPGAGHCGDGAVLSRTDVVSAIMNWVEGGDAPQSLLVKRIEGEKTVSTRPVYPYPQQSKWDGKEDTSQAESYSAAEPTISEKQVDWLAKSLMTAASQRWCEQKGMTLTCTPQ